MIATLNRSAWQTTSRPEPMEVRADGRCRVVYFCASVKDEVSKLYESTQRLQKKEAANQWEVVEQNVRTLMDEDQGGFSQGETRIIQHKRFCSCLGS